MSRDLKGNENVELPSFSVWHTRMYLSLNRKYKAQHAAETVETTRRRFFTRSTRLVSPPVAASAIEVPSTPDNTGNSSEDVKSTAGGLVRRLLFFDASEGEGVSDGEGSMVTA